MKTNTVKMILPTEEAFNNWHEIIYFSSGIPFTLDTVKAAYFMDIGYRSAMHTYSQFSFQVSKDDPWNTAVDSYLDKDDVWTENMHTDIIGTLLTNCCLIQFGMEHPKYGHSDEFKKRFEEASEKFIASQKSLADQQK